MKECHCSIYEPIDNVNRQSKLTGHYKISLYSKTIEMNTRNVNVAMECNSQASFRSQEGR